MQWSRRHSATASTALAAGWHRRADAQTSKSITVSHSVSTFGYGQHLVAREKSFSRTSTSPCRASSCRAAVPAW